MAELCEEFELHPTQINDWQLALENDFLERRAHQGGVAERFSVIDREHPLSGARQARLLDIRRGAVYYRPRPTSDASLS